MASIHPRMQPDVTPTPQSTPTGIQLDDTASSYQHNNILHNNANNIPVIETHITTHSIIHVGGNANTNNTTTTAVQYSNQPQSTQPHQWIKVESTDESRLLKRVWFISDLFVLVCFPVYCTLMIFDTPLGKTLLNNSEYSLMTAFMLSLYGATLLTLLPRYWLGRNAFQFICEVIVLMISVIVIGDFIAHNGADTLIGLVQVLGFTVPTIRVACSVALNMYFLCTAGEPKIITVDDGTDELNTAESSIEYQSAIDTLVDNIRHSSIERGELLSHEQLVAIATRMLRQHITSNVAGYHTHQHDHNHNNTTITRNSIDDNISYQLTESQENELNHTLQSRFTVQNPSPIHNNNPARSPDGILWRNELQSPIPHNDNAPSSLTSDQVDQLDSYYLSKNEIDKKTENILSGCSICLCDYQINDSVKYLPCFHLLHTQCVDIWLQQRNQCPVCRAPALIYSD